MIIMGIFVGILVTALFIISIIGAISLENITRRDPYSVGGVYANTFINYIIRRDNWSIWLKRINVAFLFIPWILMLLLFLIVGIFVSIYNGLVIVFLNVRREINL